MNVLCFIIDRHAMRRNVVKTHWCSFFGNNAHMPCVLCISAVRAACELQIAAVKISLNANAAILRLHINPLQFFVCGRKILSDAKPHNTTTWISFRIDASAEFFCWRGSKMTEPLDQWFPILAQGRGQCLLPLDPFPKKLERWKQT